MFGSDTGREIWWYLEQVRHHWLGLLAGGLMALIAVGANATHSTIPAEVWWALAFVFFGVAQFRAFRDVRRQLEAIQRRLGAAADRQERLRGTADLTGESFYVWELFEPDGKPVVTNRHFTKCTIKGPGMIALLSTGDLSNNMLGEGDIEQVLYLSTPGAHQGIFGFVNCTFERCRFRQIGFYGDENMLTKLRKAPAI